MLAAVEAVWSSYQSGYLDGRVLRTTVIGVSFFCFCVLWVNALDNDSECTLSIKRESHASSLCTGLSKQLVI